MIGYGPNFTIRPNPAARVAWPVIGVALQKNYISVYFAIAVGDKPIVDAYVGKLGELRSGINNFSFRTFDELEPNALAALFADAASRFGARSGKSRPPGLAVGVTVSKMPRWVRHRRRRAIASCATCV